MKMKHIAIAAVAIFAAGLLAAPAAAQQLQSRLFEVT